MYSLRKIKEINKYRFFQNYKWDEDKCKLFGKYNLIYGWNGCGKTTLCDLYRDLEVGIISEDDASFSLMFENAPATVSDLIKMTELNRSTFYAKEGDFTEKEKNRTGVKEVVGFCYCSKFPKSLEILIKIVYNVLKPKFTLSTVKLFLLSTSITK